MRVLVLIISMVWAGSAMADYAGSRDWFYSLKDDDRALSQFLLIFSGDYNALVDGQFGRRTYDALIRFQRRNGYRPDGVLSRYEFDRLGAHAGSAMKRIGFDFISDPRTDQTLGIPTAILPQRSATKRGTRWQDTGGRVAVETLSIPYTDTPYVKLYQRLKRQSRSRTVKYAILKDGFFVVTGFQGRKKFYLRINRAPYASKGFSMSWSRAYDDLFKVVSVATANSLTLGADALKDAGKPSAPAPAVRNTPPPPGASAPPAQAVSFGTGYVVSHQGHVVTNDHVVDDCRQIEVVGAGGASVVKADRTNDIAILQLASRQAATIVRFRGSAIKRGEEIYVMGYPLPQVLDNNLTITQGIVSSLAGVRGDIRHIQISAPIQPGNSGGPVFDTSGLVIATVVSRLSDVETMKIAGIVPQNVNFAIRGLMAASLLSNVGIEPSYATQIASISPADISENAAPAVVQIVCRK